jgi:hypothetical protein
MESSHERRGCNRGAIIDRGRALSLNSLISSKTVTTAPK